MMRLALTTLAVSALLWTGAAAAPRDEALAVTGKWAAAFAASDAAAIAALYAPDALFLGTGSPAVVTTPAGVRAYFDNAFRPRAERKAVLLNPSVLELSDSVAIVNSLDCIDQTADGTTATGMGRVTFVVAKRGERWLIVHFHRSAVPG
jgi:uncharacterized protein (TIGR02246 family)